MWYGVCLRNNTKVKNCYYDGPPKSIDSSSAEILREFCPNLSLRNETKFCCDSEQINDLAKNVEQAKNLLQRCPSCYANFLQIFCEFTCNPQQSKFIDIKKKVRLEPTSESKNSCFSTFFFNTLFNLSFHLEYPNEYVDEIDVYVTEDYLNGTYESCKSVIVPSTGAKAISLMCGSAGAERCNAEVWYNYLGNATSPFVPFQITYKRFPRDVKRVGQFIPINPEIKRCDESVDGVKPPCSCMDCALNYIQSSPTEAVKREFIFGLNQHTFLMICVFIIGSLTFLIISSFSNDKDGKLK